MSFANDVKKFEKNAIADTEAGARKKILILFNAVISDTPSARGTLRANWQTSLGYPKSGTLEATEESRATKEAERVVMGTQFGTFWLSNNLPYAPVIEYGLFPYTNTKRVNGRGYSRKSPQGMVRRNIAKLWK